MKGPTDITVLLKSIRWIPDPGIAKATVWGPCFESALASLTAWAREPGPFEAVFTTVNVSARRVSQIDVRNNNRPRSFGARSDHRRLSEHGTPNDLSVSYAKSLVFVKFN